MTVTKKKWAAVLFDMDGVLVDSEPLHGESWEEILREEGIEPPADWFSAWIGIPDHKTAAGLKAAHRLTLPAVELNERKRRSFHALVETSLQPFAGLPERIADLSVPRAVATSSGRKDAEHILSCTKLRDFFSVIVTADDVTKYKPEPEPYLQAAKLCEVNPAGCLVLEDSPAGIAAGVAAGCTVLGITSSHPATALSGAHKLFSNPSDALDWAWA